MDVSSLTKRLEAELRSSVQKLVVITWSESESIPGGNLGRTVVITQLSRLSDVVTEECAIEGASAQEAHGSTGGATLFEGHQMAVRFMLEAGKINLSLRIADEHVDGVLRSRRFAGILESDPALRGEDIVLEDSMGLLIAACWAHREGLQVTDVALASGVLTRAALAVMAPGSTRKMLALLVLRWLAALGAPMALGAIGEARVISALSRDNFFSLIPYFFTSPIVSTISHAELLAGAAGVASIIATEDFFIGPRAKLLTHHDGPDGAVATLIKAASVLPSQCMGTSSIWSNSPKLPSYANTAVIAKTSLAAVAQASIGGVAAVASARRKIRPLLDFLDAAGKING
jgi:hypothetical protein